MSMQELKLIQTGTTDLPGFEIRLSLYTPSYDLVSPKSELYLCLYSHTKSEANKIRANAYMEFILARLRERVS